MLYIQCELEALGECIPPPRHVLPVSPSGESVWAADLSPLTTFRISQYSDESGKQSLYQDGDPDRHQNLIICSLADCQPSLKILCKSSPSCLRCTSAMRCIRPKVLHTTVDAQCDKLVTVVGQTSWQHLRWSTCRGEIFLSPEFGTKLQTEATLFQKLHEFPYVTV